MSSNQRVEIDSAVVFNGADFDELGIVSSERIKGTDVYLAKLRNGKTISIKSTKGAYPSQIPTVLGVDAKGNIAYSMPQGMKVIKDSFGKSYIVGEVIPNAYLLHERILENNGDLMDRDAEAVVNYLMLVLDLPKLGTISLEALTDLPKILTPDLNRILKKIPKLGEVVPLDYQSIFERNLESWTDALKSMNSISPRPGFDSSIQALSIRLRSLGGVFKFSEVGIGGHNKSPIPTLISDGFVQSADATKVTPFAIAFYDIASKLALQLVWANGLEASKKIFDKLLDRLNTPEYEHLLEPFEKYFLSIFAQRVSGDMLDNLGVISKGGILTIATNAIGVVIEPQQIVSNVNLFLDYLQKKLRPIEG